MKTTLRLGLFGASGRMGQLVRGLALSSPDVEVVAEVDRETPRTVGFSGCDVVIDVSLPGATEELLTRLEGAPVPLVTGVTGRSAVARGLIEAHAQAAPLLIASNFSLGLTLLHRLVAEAARAVDWDLEIFELHHSQKVDAPSGTALALAESAASGRGQPGTVTPLTFPRVSGQRQPGELGLSAARGGDVVGEHTVFLLGEGERIELTHRATDRVIFARGALRAARFLVGREAGSYTLDDVLAFGHRVQAKPI